MLRRRRRRKKSVGDVQWTIRSDDLPNSFPRAHIIIIIIILYTRKPLWPTRSIPRVSHCVNLWPPLLWYIRSSTSPAAHVRVECLRNNMILFIVTHSYIVTTTINYIPAGVYDSTMCRYRQVHGSKPYTRGKQNYDNNRYDRAASSAGCIVFLRRRVCETRSFIWMHVYICVHDFY